MSTDQTLVKLTKAGQALALAETPQEAAQIARIAAAAAKYYRESGAEIPKINDCVRVKLKAERKAGALLRQMDKHKGGGYTHGERRKVTGNITLPVKYAEIGIEKMAASRFQRLAAKPEDEWNAWLADWPEEKELHSADAYRFVMGGHVKYNTGQINWHTPTEYIEAARKTMGSIELDPASSDAAQKTVKADRYFTLEDNGLEQDWACKTLWLNPPYAQPAVAMFSKKLCDGFDDKSIWQACIIVNNATETQWCQGLLARASAVCFPAGRVLFPDPEGNVGKDAGGGPMQGQVVCYLGENQKAFLSSFTQFGVCKRA